MPWSKLLQGSTADFSFMNVQDMARNWDAWGAQDPMYAILTDPDKAQGKWNEAEFFESGRKQIAARLKWLAEKGVRYPTGRALDFGCGIGRLTNALAAYFNEVHGVDISQSMVERARQSCRVPTKIQFFQNTAPDLAAFKEASYDFIYTEIVLQHIPPKFQLRYIDDFFRLLSPGGIVFFQTVRTIGFRRLVPEWAVELVRSWKNRGKPFIPMYAVRPEQIERLASARGCQLLFRDTFAPAATAGRFVCDVYVIGRAGLAGS